MNTELEYTHAREKVRENVTGPPSWPMERDKLLDDLTTAREQLRRDAGAAGAERARLEAALSAAEGRLAAYEEETMQEEQSRTGAQLRLDLLTQKLQEREEHISSLSVNAQQQAALVCQLQQTVADLSAEHERFGRDSEVRSRRTILTQTCAPFK
eukprot:TRINITY_DN3926_c0_g1_i2.p1 TRINITY_DN3926_c0_g1~~TRINITY_DN3926_c0_g1_i2.p1  ORF type:complete len:155 (-),score=40.93 TRINITY_DN3926_c0_g1_i2:36-500(-)